MQQKAIYVLFFRSYKNFELNGSHNLHINMQIRRISQKYKTSLREIDILYQDRSNFSTGKLNTYSKYPLCVRSEK